MEKLKSFLMEEMVRYNPNLNKVVSNTNREVNYLQLFSAYSAIVTKSEDFINKAEFPNKVKEITKKMHNENETTSEKEFRFETVYEVEDLIEQAMDLNDIEFSQKGDKVVKKGTPDTVPLDDIINIILFHRDKYEKDTGKEKRPRFSVDETKRAISFIISEKAFQNKEKVRDTLKYAGNDFAAYTDNVLKNVIDAFDVKPEDKRVCFIALKQWMWQVKAYLYGHSVPDPLLINIFGVMQGTGKTFFVSHLGKALFDYMDVDIKLKHALDDNEATRFSENYILFFDELVVGAGSQDYTQVVAAFKKILTAKVLNPRVLYTQKRMKLNRIYSAISTSNTPMVDTIYDDTGMRRFFEIPVHADSKDNPVKLLKELEFEEEKKGKMHSQWLWQGIDENLKGGYAPAGSEGFEMIRAVQDTYKRGSIIELVLEHAEDLEHYPVEIKSSLGIKIQKIIDNLPHNTSFTDMAKKIEKNVVPIHQIRREMAEWIKDNMGYDEARALKRSHNLGHALKSLGYMVIDYNNSQRVICDNRLDDIDNSTNVNL